MGEVPVRELFEQRWTDHLSHHVTQDQVRREREEMIRDMVKLARQGIEYRLEEMNNLRSQIANERGLYLRRDTWETSQLESSKRVAAIELQLAALSGRDKGIGTSWAVAIGLIGAAGAIGAVVSRLWGG